MRWTPEQLADYERRRNPPQVNRTEAVDDESQLHNDIKQHCKNKGWRYVNARMDKRSSIGEGICDFIIAADNGRVFWIECKSKTGKISLGQSTFIVWLLKLGHTVHVVTNMDQFLEIVSGPTAPAPGI